MGKNTAERVVWRGMLDRCNNEKSTSYVNYGGRGIRVCPEWEASYEAFLASVGPRPSPSHTLDRIDNDGNYEPGNVRWATPSQQARNKRNTVWVEIDGQKMALVDAAEKLGLSPVTVDNRIRRGMPPERWFRRPRPQAKLSAEDIEQIRSRRASGEFWESIAADFGVCRRAAREAAESTQRQRLAQKPMPLPKGSTNGR